MTARSGGDPAGLGRGPLTRWLPVLWQAPPDPPHADAFAVAPGLTPRRFLLRVVFSVKRLTVPATALAVLWQVGESLVPILMGIAIDRALETGDAAQLALWLALLGLNFLALSFAFRFSAQLTARATEQVQHGLRAALSRSVLHPTAGSVRQPDGGLVSTMTNDVTRLAAVGLTVYPIAELAAIAFIAVSLLLIHWPLGVCVLIGAPIAVWLMVRLSDRLAHDTRAYQTLLAETVGRATDLVAGYRVIKGVRAEAEATRRYRDASRRTLAGAHRNIRLLGRFLIGSDTVSGVFVAGVAGLAAWFALTGRLSVGGLIAAVGLAQALLPPMQMLAQNAVPLWAGAIASGGRILDILKDAATGESPEQETTAIAPTTVPAVTFSLPSDDAVRVDPGELVGVRADDRTAARIAGALLDPQAPDAVPIHLDGVPAARLHPEAYRSRVVVSPHHATLFSGTIADNLDVPGAPPESRDAAMRAAACDDFVPAAEGAQETVGEMGNRFSGGQRQRLALARALAADAPVLVLHDPTTAVDSVTEAAIASGLREMRRDRSTILIASSPALLSVCDRVVDVPGTERGDAP
ncbi:ABC transporter ATP-binding protein [Microbacterium sp. 18062]|uniref:ABC transporter transmembrane domain-containing protein n=1 Tax=Microbacterium sp. 18062 TaxID=2681410 RepID=UPI00190F3DC8|nr:ABC transporter ATP-binding protein [Microbacterium sp. 18062]